ncbi:MAG: hypothetical protein V4558_05380 [Gemmatimonadota bacterium]
MSSATRTRAMVLLIVAFVAGTVVGVVGLTAAFRAGKADFIWRGQGGSRGPGGVPGGYAAWVAKELDASAVQRDSIAAIFKRGTAAMDTIRRSIGPQVDSLFESIRPSVETVRQQSRTEVRALLTPPQQVRYDSMNTAMDENRKKQREQSPRGGPRGPR